MKPLSQLSDEEFHQLARCAAAMPDAPPALVRAAVSLWDTARRPGLREAAAAMVERIAAVLAFDSWAGGAVPAGLRSVPTDSRHLLFNAKGRDIDLRIVPVRDRFALTGQVLGPDEAGQVELVAETGESAGGPALRVAALDELGEFRLEDVERGVYRMVLHVGADAIELPRIEVGERRE